MEDSVIVTSSTMMCLALTQSDLTRVLGEDRHKCFTAPEKSHRLRLPSGAHKKPF